MSEINSTVIYREIPGFPGYRVGDDGSIWTCKAGGNFKIKFTNTWKKRNVCNLNGYCIIMFKDRDSGYRQQWLVHRLVLTLFVGECPEGMEACHKNGNRKDNRLCNLRWDTPKNNAKDKILHDTNGHGEASSLCVISDADVEKMREEYIPGITSYYFLARKYGISVAHTRDIVNMRRRVRSTPDHLKWEAKANKKVLQGAFNENPVVTDVDEPVTVPDNADDEYRLG